MTEFALIQSISVDCYGLLIDWESGIAAALRPWAGRNNVALNDEELIQFFGVHETRVQNERPFRQYPEVLAETMRRIGAELERPVSEVEAYAFSRSVGSWHPFDDTVASLIRLSERFPITVVTNVDDVGFRQSNDLLDVVFDSVITAESVGSYKPASRHFDALVKLLADQDRDVSRHLHVAQSLYHDIGPAQEHGLSTCWIDRRQDRIGYGATPQAANVAPDYRFSTLAEFTDAVFASNS